FSSRRRHTISKRDWSSDVCSSDLMDDVIFVWNRLYELYIKGRPIPSDEEKIKSYFHLSQTQWRFLFYQMSNHDMIYGRNIIYNKQRSEEHTSELQSRFDLVCRLLL